MSCLMIAGLFLILDLAILFYFIRLPSNEDVEQVAPASPVMEQSSMTVAPDGPQGGK